MNINNNLNNNKQVNFKADLKACTKISDNLYSKLSKIAKDAKGTEGDIVEFSESIVSHPHDSKRAFKEYIIKFDYSRKEGAFSKEKPSIAFSTIDHKKFGIWDYNNHKFTDWFNAEGKDNKIVEFFQKIMDSVSK